MFFLLRWLVVLIKPLVSRFPRLAAMYRGMRDQLECMEEPQLTPWGFKLAGNTAMAQGTFEPVETALVLKLLDEVDVFINVGANVGYYCCHALGMGKSVIAFEPMPRNLRFLCKNINANGWDGAEIFPVALSNKVSILEIYGANTGASLVKGWAGAPESYKTLVPCSTMDLLLDSRLKGKRALILVDIEGAEKWMLEGASKMLSNDPKPIWVVEIVTSENQPEGVAINPNFTNTFQFFFESGYEAFSADQEMRPITIEEVALYAKGALKAGTHNFMFRELKR
jgi:FkbM family methyltransferase